jgi:Kef-type K+ transport system membrane component KefB/mannitol/fructose-specific phosphotransferase system IIA component (Ntr-type)
MMYDQLFIFSVLLFSAFIAPVIANKTKIPSIVFYILFGVLLERFVFRLEALGESFSIFSDVGKLYLMFITGLEIDTYLFKKNVTKSAVFGVLTFIIPQALGTIIIISVFGYTTSAAILIASFFASHTLLSLVIINKFGIENSEPVSVAVGASIVSDIAVLALLAILADTSRGVNIPAVYWALMFGSWALLISAILFVVPKIAQKVFQVLSEDGNAQFLFVFATVCLISWIAHFLRLKPLIGAFFCGLALSRLVPNRSILMTKVTFVGYTFFIPFFFISAGMHINPQRSAEFVDALFLGAVLTVLTIVAKTAAAIIFGKVYKYSWNAIAMTAGMTFQQAATTIVCAVVGLEIGIINETIFNAAMILILLSCTIGEVVSVHFAGKYAQNLSGRTMSLGPFESKTPVFVPNIAACKNLLDFADLFKFHAKKHVISPLALAIDNCQESIADAETILGFCMNHATEIEDNYHPEMRIAANAVDGILRGAAETRADLVVCPFVNYSPTLIDKCPPRLIFAKVTEVIATTKRIRVVFMPTSENRADLSLFLAEIKNLSQLAGADVIFYLTESQGKKINEKIHKYLKDNIKYKIILKANWNAVKRGLPEQIKNSDIIMFSMATRHKLFRLASIEKYPLQLSEKFVENSVFAAYPPLSMVGAEDDYGQLDDDAAQGMHEDADFEAIEASSSDLREITALIAQKIEAEHAELYDTLLPSFELYPVELIPGTVLVHTHTEAVADTRIFVWLQSAPNTILPVRIAPNVLIVVLNPLHGDPQEHLKALARIAGLFMRPNIGKIISGSQNSAELAERLRALN